MEDPAGLGPQSCKVEDSVPPYWSLVLSEPQIEPLSIDLEIEPDNVAHGIELEALSWTKQSVPIVKLGSTFEESNHLGWLAAAIVHTYLFDLTIIIEYAGYSYPAPDFALDRVF
jgi:hypothetical protein